MFNRQKIHRYKIIWLFLSSLLLSCSSSERMYQQFDKGKLDKEFQEAYSYFEKENYSVAIDKLKEFIKIDSTMYHYVAYSFLSESYNNIGIMDSGLAVLAIGTEKLKSLAERDPNNFQLLEKFDSLSAWKKMYPIFPSFLKKENGFSLVNVEPVPIYQEPPVYPLTLKRLGIQGECWLKVVIDERGIVTNIAIHKSSNNELLDKSALDALSKWIFKPWYRYGRVGKFKIAVPFRFRIN